ncbi:protein-serine/threonine phosphatase [Trifolium repens]|nr:protein-serine/threonine phosphatase [Trifolium repens]
MEDKIRNKSDLLFSRSFNYLRFPCFNLPPKPPSQILPFSPSIPFPRRTCHTHVLPNSTSSSTPAPQQPEQDDVNVISSTRGTMDCLMAYSYSANGVIAFFSS